MSARVLAGSEASGRLAELGLTIELIERVVRRADAEASMCTALDPPIMEGLTLPVPKTSSAQVGAVVGGSGDVLVGWHQVGFFPEDLSAAA